MSKKKEIALGLRAKTEQVGCAFTCLLAVCLSAFTMIAPANALPDGVEAEAYATGLRFPVAMTPTPDGDVLVTEKGIDVDGGPSIPGAVRLIDDGTLVEEPIATFEVKTINESGMLGIDLMPDFAQSGEFLVVYTPEDDQQHIYMSKLRLKDDNTAEIVEKQFLTLPSRKAATRHYGGNLMTTDNYIYVSLSDVTQDKHPQDLSTLNGSILRYNLDGTVPEDNPFGADNPIFAYGLRNCFDLDDDADGRIYCGENGHSRHDHINYVRAGHNFGWPMMLGHCDHHPVLERCEGHGFTEPAHEFSYRVGPTGMLMYEGSMFPDWQGDAFLGGWHTGEVHHLTPGNESGTQLDEMGRAFFVLPEGPFGLRNDAEKQHLDQYGVTDVAEASDGAILVLESGVDRGTLYRIAPSDQIINPDNVVELGDRRLKNVTIDRACSVGPGSQTGGSSGFWACLLVAFAALVGRRLHGVRSPTESGWPKMALAAMAIVAVIGVGQTAQAQGLEMEYGGMIGVDASTPSGDNIYNGHFGVGTSALGAVRVGFIPYLGVQADLGYSLKGSGLKRTTERLNLTYITLPVTVYGQFPLGDVDLRVHAGGSNNLLLRAAMSDGPPFTDKLQRYEFGAIGGVGVDISTNWPFDLTVDARYERGLTRLLDPAQKPDYLGAIDRAWTNTIYLYAGALF